MVDCFVWGVICFWQHMWGRRFYGILGITSTWFLKGLLKEQTLTAYLPHHWKKILFTKKDILAVSLPLKWPRGCISVKNCMFQDCQKLQILVQPNSRRRGSQIWKHGNLKLLKIFPLVQILQKAIFFSHSLSFYGLRW